MLPGYPAGVAATSPPYPTSGEVSKILQPVYPAIKYGVLASGKLWERRKRLEL